jgi:oligosaccharide repeat unit polymerase
MVNNKIGKSSFVSEKKSTELHRSTRRFFIILFFLFSGLDPFTLLTGGIISVGVGYFLTLLICVVVPLLNSPIHSFSNMSMRVPILMIVGVVVLRFIADLFVTSSIAQGPYRTFFISGCFYLLYLVLGRKLNDVVLDETIRDFVVVSSVVSCIPVLSVLGFSLPIFTTLRTYEVYGAEVGEFARLQTTYHHFSVLAVMFSAYLMIDPRLPTWRKFRLGLLGLLNFWNVLISGYRANLYVLLSVIALFGVYLIFVKREKGAIWVAMLLIPISVYVSRYIAERNLETASETGSDSSLAYRYIELGYGFDKLDEKGNWLLGVGYNDGFLNPVATPGEQETYFLHNGYASILYDYGIVGTLAWLALILYVAVFIMKRILNNRRNLLFIMLSLYFLGQLVVNFSSGIFNREISATFCFILAVDFLERAVIVSRESSLPSPGLCP